jgi:hypothetical protein
VVVQRTSVGLDVHARSVVACAVVGSTGEMIEARLTPAHRDVIAWVKARLAGGKGGSLHVVRVVELTVSQT